MIDFITNSLSSDAQNLKNEVSKVNKIAKMLKDKCSVIQKSSNQKEHITLAKWIESQINDIQNQLTDIEDGLAKMSKITNKCLNKNEFEEKYY